VLGGLHGLRVQGADEASPLAEREPHPAVRLQLGGVLLVRGQLRIVRVDGEQQVCGGAGVVPRLHDLRHGLGLPRVGMMTRRSSAMARVSYAGSTIIQATVDVSEAPVDLIWNEVPAVRAKT
jgi:hypothetical protein